MSLHDEEWQLIGRALFMGFGLSLLYDFLRLMRRTGGRGVTFLCDLAFTGCAAAASFSLLQKYSNGMLRWYAAGAVFLAVWLYGRVAHGIVCRCLDSLFFWMKQKLLVPVKRYLFHPAKIFLTKGKEAVIMKLHLKRKEADNDEAGI